MKIVVGHDIAAMSNAGIGILGAFRIKVVRVEGGMQRLSCSDAIATVLVSPSLWTVFLCASL